MSASRTVIRFHNIYQLWAFAQNFHPTNIEIRASEVILICNCTEEDLQMLSKYHGEVIDNIKPVFNHTNKNQ